LEQQHIKNVVLQAESRKITRACDKTTSFGTSSGNINFLLPAMHRLIFIYTAVRSFISSRKYRKYTEKGANVSEAM